MRRLRLLVAVSGLIAVPLSAQLPQAATDQLRRMVYAYPTFHRAVEDALSDLVGGLQKVKGRT